VALGFALCPAIIVAGTFAGMEIGFEVLSKHEAPVTFVVVDRSLLRPLQRVE
jgi:hypothetical protein